MNDDSIFNNNYYTTQGISSVYDNPVYDRPVPRSSKLERETVEMQAQPLPDGRHACIDDTKSVREGLFKSLYEIKNKGFQPKTIYLGCNWLRALDELFKIETGYYGSARETFAGVPLYEVAGDPYHFFIAIEEPKL